MDYRSILRFKSQLSAEGFNPRGANAKKMLAYFATEESNGLKWKLG